MITTCSTLTTNPNDNSPRDITADSSLISTPSINRHHRCPFALNLFMFASTFCINVDIKRGFFCVFLLLSVPFVHLKGEWCTWSMLSASGFRWNEKWKDGEREEPVCWVLACCWRRLKLPRENRTSSFTGSTLEPLTNPTVPNRLISSVCFSFLFTVVAGNWFKVVLTCPKCSQILNKTGIVLGNA